MLERGKPGVIPHTASQRIAPMWGVSPDLPDGSFMKLLARPAVPREPADDLIYRSLAN